MGLGSGSVRKAYDQLDDIESSLQKYKRASELGFREPGLIRRFYSC